MRARDLAEPYPPVRDRTTTPLEAARLLGRARLPALLVLDTDGSAVRDPAGLPARQAAGARLRTRRPDTGRRDRRPARSTDVPRALAGRPVADWLPQAAARPPSRSRTTRRWRSPRSWRASAARWSPSIERDGGPGPAARRDHRRPPAGTTSSEDRERLAQLGGDRRLRRRVRPDHQREDPPRRRRPRRRRADAGDRGDRRQVGLLLRAHRHRLERHLPAAWA